jgi:hypothetical protein
VIDVADVILTTKQLEDIFWTLTCQLLGIDPEKDQSSVRISWPKDGSLGWKITDDIVFVRVTPDDDPYIQQRHVTYEPNPDGTLQKVAKYTRAHSIHWICYGPDSNEKAETIRNGLYQLETASSLAENNLFLVLSIPAPIRSPELFNGQWWERAELQVTYYEQVIRYTTVPSIQSVDVRTLTEQGEVK